MGGAARLPLLPSTLRGRLDAIRSIMGETATPPTAEPGCWRTRSLWIRLATPSRCEEIYDDDDDKTNIGGRIGTSGEIRRREQEEQKALEEAARKREQRE